jgi:hypothetical protein
VPLHQKISTLPREARLLFAGCTLFPRSEDASEGLQEVILEYEKKRAGKKGRSKKDRIDERQEIYKQIKTGNKKKK